MISYKDLIGIDVTIKMVVTVQPSKGGLLQIATYSKTVHSKTVVPVHRFLNNYTK